MDDISKLYSELWHGMIGKLNRYTPPLSVSLAKRHARIVTQYSKTHPGEKIIELVDDGYGIDKIAPACFSPGISSAMAIRKIPTGKGRVSSTTSTKHIVTISFYKFNFLNDSQMTVAETQVFDPNGMEASAEFKVILGTTNKTLMQLKLIQTIDEINDIMPNVDVSNVSIYLGRLIYRMKHLHEDLTWLGDK